VRGWTRKQGFRDCQRYLEARLSCKDTCALLEENALNDDPEVCGLDLAKTNINAPATRELWNLKMPIFRDSCSSLGHMKTQNWPRPVRKEVTTDSLSPLDIAGLLLKKALSYSIKATDKGHTNINPLEDARPVTSYWEAA
jgi:hypothetical protein